MVKSTFFNSGNCKLLIAASFALLIFALTPGIVSAQTPTPTNGPPNQWCIGQYGRDGCTANDFGIQEVILWHVYEPCGSDPAHPGQALVDFEVVFSSSASTRYDVGLFMALDGGSAVDGWNTCHHAYLDGGVTTSPIYNAYYTKGESTPYPTNDNVELPAPIYTPAPTIVPFNGWWDGDGDTCGDMEPRTSAIMRYTGPIWMACADRDQNGIVDIHVCGSYDNNGKADCFDVAGAYPGTESKCGCLLVNLDFTPTAIENLNFSASPSAFPMGMALSVLGLILLGGALLSGYIRHRARIG